MICKFFKTKKGGGVSSINYLLNERVQQGTARILKGDENITREVIKMMNQKHKTCVGCLSFEEQNIDENAKKEIMESFEETLLTPAMRGRYNILWVEHTDKGRLELNFVIPKIDLETQKSFNPYFHKADSKRIEIWSDFVNFSYGFSNPKDPAKENTLQGSKKAYELIKDYETLDKMLHEQVSNRVITSRDELIEALKKSNIEVTRKGKDYLSIKLPDSKKAKRFKGGIYNEQFTSIEKLGGIREQQEERAREFKQRDTRKELERIKPKLDELIRRKDDFYREFIQKSDETRKRAFEREARASFKNNLQSRADEIQDFKSFNELPTRNASNGDFIDICLVSVDKALSNKQGIYERGTEREKISLDTKNNDERTGKSLLFSDRIEKRKDDNFRNRINSRNREIARRDIEISRRNREFADNSQERARRTQEHKKRLSDIVSESREVERRQRELRELLQDGIRKFRERIKREIKQVVEKISKFVKRDFGMNR
ncbi:relaxase/mobilization nuclease domain-containing protein [Campylobacter lari]|nr:mobilization protein [Campylobacter lari]EGK8096242.1 relaxase/mobilization nuclease domain-containing protein [Campylobacter lari]MCV3342321.1 relaxase/mobilization nuclease domain-containing protein [Campylobacter lari]MCV3385201.1 relaxase/mobilization nuclease domain-containing protein [Campylobacter lari]MCV3396107.1 relaxase/mobilization nuclease domain-containing protein [Campylobacter lari]